MVCPFPGKWTWGKPAESWKSLISSRRMPARMSVWPRTPGEWTQWKENSLSTVGECDVHEYLTSVHHICQTWSDWDATAGLIRQRSAEDCAAYMSREARFNGTSKWLKAVSHDASNILIQIKRSDADEVEPLNTTLLVSPVLDSARWHHDWHPTWAEIKAFQCTIHRPVTHMSGT